MTVTFSLQGQMHSPTQDKCSALAFLTYSHVEERKINTRISKNSGSPQLPKPNHNTMRFHSGVW